ncbi:carboxypeptidase-like regulatory domain-containing protein [Hymenobacter sp. DH14]|uniref:Carboxypeptidase-like regulatory domain-containing protein n=1 Tax=Hymenobacter cyanobacteriorum TaxID=2926463 RepID=A0A9X2AGU3_9BACT|nr:carboxypeptidase-like regulatory domain-containing protein [Hymenobacter cyanobacteriorum]MCI1189202.1 carboxypeptidase-like regulatory domain-containing protein [Hymenobacter cyanobacteriorum]
MKYLMMMVKLALLLTATIARAQQQPASPAAPATLPTELECRVLTGRVTDPFAYPLTGATIMLRIPGQGFSPDAFSTNSEGHYIITAKQAIPRNTVMEVTAVGYATLELPLINCKPLDLTMMPLVSTSYKGKPRNKKPSGSGKVR